MRHTSIFKPWWYHNQRTEICFNRSSCWTVSSMHMMNSALVPHCPSPWCNPPSTLVSPSPNLLFTCLWSIVHLQDRIGTLISDHTRQGISRGILLHTFHTYCNNFRDINVPIVVGSRYSNISLDSLRSNEILMCIVRRKIKYCFLNIWTSSKNKKAF